jgi:hypothetical protein
MKASKKASKQERKKERQRHGREGTGSHGHFPWQNRHLEILTIVHDPGFIKAIGAGGVHDSIYR